VPIEFPPPLVNVCNDCCSGPSKASLDNADRPKANAADLEKGEYVFSLTVYDAQDQSDEATVKVKVRSRKLYL